MHGPEPEQDECAELSYRNFYSLAGRQSNMRVLGFKCIQGMSGQGGDIEWWKYEVAGNDLPEYTEPRTKPTEAFKGIKNLEPDRLLSKVKKGNYIVTLV